MFKETGKSFLSSSFFSASAYKNLLQLVLVNTAFIFAAQQ